MTHVIVMAKAPVAGLAKTRLAPALGADGAARLAARLLDHALRAADAAGLGPVWLACAPDTSHAAFARAAAGGVRVIAQAAGGLGARMHGAFAHAFAAGAKRVLLIGTDAPAIDAALLRRAEAALATPGADAVFVPAFDGGYALIGLVRAQPQLLDDDGMPWSTPTVMAHTRERLARLGLRAAELPAVHDIDRPADLAHLPGGPNAWLSARL